MHPSTALADVLVDELVRGGVGEAVLAPGSRSAPLAYALEDADRAGRLRLHVRVDERSAGFLALGLARASGRPVPVLTTSGTAVANLHPAVLEAHHSGIPLVVLSADRPAELRGTGANQTTVQPGIFAGAVRWGADLPAPEAVTGAANAHWRSTVCRALAAATDATSSDGWLRSGPVHLNVSLRDPLAPDAEGRTDLPDELAGRPDGAPWTRALHAPPFIAWEPPPRRDRTVVLLGDLTRPHLHDVALTWAEQCGWPVLAEPFGRLPHGQTVVPHGVLVAGDAAALAELAPDRVVVVGRLTLFRELGALLRRPGMTVEQISATPAWTDPSHVVQEVRGIRALSLPAEPADPRWAQAWIQAGEGWSGRVRAAAGLGEEASGNGPMTGVGVAATVAAALSDDDVLVLGSSNAPRDLALGLRAIEQVGSPVVLANRGVAGIDGTVSTALGVALAVQAPDAHSAADRTRGHAPDTHSAADRTRGLHPPDPHAAPQASRTVALMGDLTFLHDSNGLIVGPAEPRPDLTVVVVNDDGGGIFSTLEYGEPARSATAEGTATTERLFGTPHGTDLAALCAAHGVAHVRVDTLCHLTDLLAGPGDGIRVLEVPVDRTTHRAVRDRLR